MAESEIQILIRAVDEVSATMKRIESNLEKSNKAIQDSNKQTMKTWNDQVGGLLVLGQAVQSVDNIFSAYTNLQLRLENATERVNGAQDRLAKAQRNLAKVQRDVNASSEDLADAQQEVTAASRGLTVAQNNLAKANNAVFGTYIQMGLAAGQLIASLPTLIKTVRSLEITVGSFTLTAGPLIASLLAIGVVVGVIVGVYGEYKRIVEETNAAQQASVENITNLSAAFKELYDNAKRTRDAVSQVKSALMGFAGGQSEEEAELLARIAEQEHELAEARLSGNEAEIRSAENSLERSQLLYEAKFASQQKVNEALINLESIRAQRTNEEQQKINDFARLSYEEQLTFLKDTFYAQLRELKDADFQTDLSNVNTLISKQHELNKAIAEGEAASSNLGNIIDSFFRRLLGGGKNKSSTTTVGDAIIRPDGSVIQTDPRDTLIAAKDLGASFGGMGGGSGGLTVVIEGNVYGTDPEQMAKEIWKLVRRKISI